MTDLRKAAEMALEAFEVLDRRGGLGLDVHEYIRTKIEALRQALAQPEQEFVGACVTCGAPKGEWLVDAVNMSQERVDETAKRKHEWVGLTDEEVGTLTVFDGLHHVETPLLADFARAIEAKLKEKNG